MNFFSLWCKLYVNFDGLTVQLLSLKVTHRAYSEATSLRLVVHWLLACAFCIGGSLIAGLEYGMKVKLWNSGMEHGMEMVSVHNYS